MTPQDLKAWRKRMGWTQARAAEELGFAFTQGYQHLEYGRNPVTAKTAKLCELLEKQKAGH